MLTRKVVRDVQLQIYLYSNIYVLGITISMENDEQLQNDSGGVDLRGEH